MDQFNKAPQLHRSWLRTLNWWLAILAAVLILGSAALPWINRAREGGGRVRCPSNLRQIGLAMKLYADAHAGHYPDSFAEILLTEDVTPEVFVCPNSSGSHSTAPTTREAAADLSNPEHCSYIYAAKGLTTDAPLATVLAYEPLANHREEGMNVLFGDGHVEFIKASKARMITAALQAGHNPPGS